MQTNKNPQVKRTLNFDFENISSDFEEDSGQFDQFLNTKWNCKNRDAPEYLD
jgi:hypothetical protein